MPIQPHTKEDVLTVLSLLKDKLASSDPQLLDSLSESEASKATSPAAVQAKLTSDVQGAIDFVHAEPFEQGEDFHSRHPLAGLAQAHLSEAANQVNHNTLGDALPAVVNVFGEGNPIVWAPVLVNILLQHLLPKAVFKTATDAESFIKIPNQCSIALLGDWGADNDHAQRIAALVRARNPDIAIHLGDIYYAGTEYETERFLANWPMADPGKSYALNGNHEMYSLGIPYFNTLLPAFGQEASYFTLYNDNWQIHGLDTAYVPFSIDGDVQVTPPPNFWQRIIGSISAAVPFLGHENFQRTPDARLKTQWDWLQQKITANPKKKNIFLSHNQPVSAYLPEFQAGAFLYNEFWKLRETIPAGMHAVWAWFFGHEHKCTIYDDTQTEFRARLIGHGSIPHTRQTLVEAAKDETKTSCTAVFTMNDRPLENDVLGIKGLDLAISGFAILTLDGPDAFVEYINEDGSLFLREKLTGTPNEVLEWGAGYHQVGN
jgi:hypothetical protein